MFTVIGLMFAGVVTGFLLRKKRLVWLNRLITCLIWVLLFVLGVEVGGNRQIMEGLATLGVEAVVITFFAVFGSCIAAWGLWFLIYKKEKTGR